MWSLAWEQGSPGGEPYWVDLPDGSRWIQFKTPVSVEAGTGGTLRIVSPDSARLIVTTAEAWGSAGEAELVPTTDVELPECAEPDTYPGLIMMPEAGCVSIEITTRSTGSYPIEVPIGVPHCA